MRMVVEVQLDADVSPRELTRRLRRMAELIEYIHARREKAARSHRKRRLRDLRSQGIYISKLSKCFNVL